MEELDGSAIEFNGWYDFPFIQKDELYAPAKTPLAQDTETWNSLKGRTGSALQAAKLFKRHGHTRVPKSHIADLAAYVEQAENFYQSSKLLNVRSRPLLQYYCYLNLAKALLLLKSNALPPEGHGIAMDNNVARLGKPFKSQVIKFKNAGVAVDLFRVFSFDIRDCEVPLYKSFAFVQEISGQVVRTQYSYSRYHRFAFIPGKVWRIRQPGGKYFNLIALRADAVGHMPDLLKLKRYFSNFFDEYRQVLVNLGATDLKFLGIKQQDGHGYKFFAGPSREYAHYGLMNDELEKALNGGVLPSVVPSGDDFTIFVPENNTATLRLNEFLSIYMATFFFSGVVRYRPSYFSSFANKEDNWLYESFVQTTPLKMLRYFHFFITKELEKLERY